MIIPKLRAALAAGLLASVSAVAVMEFRASAALRVTADQQSATASAEFERLKQQVATETKRAAAAEATVTALLTSARSRAAAPVAVVNTADALAATLARAKTLLAAGRKQEALDEYVSCYRDLAAQRPGSSECQSLMGAMKSLGTTFPPAFAALASLRDAALAQLQTQSARRELPFEIALLNERLGQGDRTLALFDALPPGDPGRQSLAMIAQSSFVAARRYSDALLGRNVGQLLGRFDGSIMHMPKLSPEIADHARRSIIETTVTSIEILTGAGHADAARTLTEKLLAFDTSDTTRTALQGAVARAQAPALR